jgi:Ca2+-binding RTX toxin-like protein
MTFSLSGRPFQVEAIMELYGSPSGTGWQYDTFQGSSLLLTYSYSTNANSTFRSIYNSAFSELSTYLNVTFQQISDQPEFTTGSTYNPQGGPGDGNADLRLSQQSDTTRAGGWGGAWYYTTDADADMEDIDGLNQIWSVNYYTIFHELGHALTLKHTTPGASPDQAPYLQAFEQNNNYTVMHYKLDGNSNITYAADGEWDYRHFQLYDVYALQLRFGVNTSTYAGNTIHTATSLGMDQWMRVLWDASGTDTIDMSAQTRTQRIDLRDGTFSDIGSVAGNNPTGNNIAIAIGAQIENANGGSGSDTITGNLLANSINGNDGNDTIVGSAGSDTLDGGSGTDLVQYGSARSGYTVTSSGAGYLVAKAGGGTDSVINIENVQFTDGTFAISSLVSGGGTSGNGIPYPTTSITVEATGYFSGSTANERILTNNISNTWVYGGGGDDYITAYNWNLQIVGDDGNDVLEAQDSSIGLTGGAGADYFVFDPTTIADLPGWITDWGFIRDYADGTDKIAIINSSLVTSFSQLQPFLSQSGSNVAIQITGLQTIFIENISLSSLDATDFVFSATGNGGGGGSTTITGTTGNDTLTGTAVGEIIIGLAGDDTMNGNDGDDSFRVSGTGDGFDVFNGGNGNDTVIATAANTVIGLAGASGIETYSSGGFANVSILTRAVNETFNFTGATLNGIVQIDANGGDDVITGSAAGDKLLGNTGNDTLNGAGGDDTLNGGAGTNILDGGAGTDMAQYAGNRNLYTVILNANGSYTVSGNGSADTLTTIENVQFADGTFAISSLVGPPSITGTTGNDTLTGTSAGEVIIGLAGNDTMNGNDGDDTFRVSGTGDGFDIINGGNDNDIIIATSNNTNIGLFGLSNVETISSGGFSNVQVVLSTGVDTYNFTGTVFSGIVRIDAGAGNDSITGGAGAETIMGNSGNDTLNGGGGIDTVDYSYRTANSTISLATTAAQTIASGDVDTLSNFENVIGGSANDTITGSAAVNVLNGGSGNDRLRGNAGNDTIIGGVGTTDVAVYAGTQATYTIATNNGVVTVTDNAPTVNGNDGTDTIQGIERVEFQGGVQVSVASPVILDLNGDGIQLLHNSETRVAFDWDRDGAKDQTGWISQGDAFLFLDRDGNGTVTNSGELSFVDDREGALSDLHGLAAFDSNGDGILFADDAAFASFKVWQDRNSNGKAEAREILTLLEAGIESIDLTGTAVNRTWDWGENMVINTGSFNRTNGSSGVLFDVAISYDARSAAQSGAESHPTSPAFDSIYDFRLGNPDMEIGSYNCIA